jgi:hypothetical protein
LVSGALAAAPDRARPSAVDVDREGVAVGAARREVWGAAIVARHYRDLTRAVQAISVMGPFGAMRLGA